MKQAFGGRAIALRIFPVRTVSISVGARQSTTITEHNMAYDPYDSSLAETDVAIANFDLHTIEGKAYMVPA